MSELQVAKWCMNLEWKKEILSGAGTEESPYVYGEVIPLDMVAIEAWMRANAGEQYCGNQAHSKLELWFIEEPSQGEKDAVEAYWDAIDGESDEAASYQSAASRAADVASKKATAKAKLIALGLTEDEVAAMVG